MYAGADGSMASAAPPFSSAHQRVGRVGLAPVGLTEISANISWSVRELPPRIWTIYCAKIDFPPWHAARTMPLHIRACRRHL
jgi:hypothetical protein